MSVKYKDLDVVELKDGRKGTIVDECVPGELFIIEIDDSSHELDFFKAEDIQKLLS